MKEFNKLVRDQIIDIIKQNGDTAKFRVLDNDAEYVAALLAKDVEEGLELAEDLNLGEFADKIEVLYALAKTQGFSPEQIEKARLQKRTERGGFDERIFLESTN